MVLNKRGRLLKRLKTLYCLELFSAFFLPFCFWTSCSTWGQAIGINSIAAIVLNALLLVEGSYFWFSIYRKIVRKGNENYIGFFKRVKPVNIFLIVLTLVLICGNSFESTFDMVGTFSFFLLAVLEQVNYFEMQLMYDNENDLMHLRVFKRLKKAKLSRKLTNL